MTLNTHGHHIPNTSSLNEELERFEHPPVICDGIEGCPQCKIDAAHPVMS